MKIGIIGANPFSGNRGVNALAYSILQILTEVLGDLRNHEILFLEPHYIGENRTIKVGKLSVYVNLFPLLNSFKTTISLVLKKKKIFFKATIGYDVILDITGGDSFSDIYGQNRYNYAVFVKRIYRRFAHRYILMPQTIGPFNNINNERIARKRMLLTDYVFARDDTSYRLLSRLGIKNSSNAIDVAFFLPYQKKIFDTNHIHVGLNISALLWHGGYSRNNQFCLKDDYKTLVRQIIEYFLEMENIILHLIPHVVGGERTIENDYAVSYDLYEEYQNGNLVLAPLFLDPILAKNYISGMDFFIGGRMHAAIAAFSSGVPVYPMAYSRKFNGLFIETLQYDFMGDLVTQDNDSIVQSIKTVFNDRSLLRDVITDRLTTIVSERKRLLMETLTKLLNL